MKRILIAIILIGLGRFVDGQNYVPSKEDINAFFTTKTLVVLEDNPMLEYNSIIKDIMKQEWNITEYDFITDKEFEEKRKDPQYSFIYMAQVTFEADKTDAIYRFLHLSLGGDYFRLNEMPDIVAVPLSYYDVEEENYSYKLALLVRFMQNHVKLVSEHPEIMSANMFKHYNDNIKDIQDKTLYVLESELSSEVNSAARIKKIYPYKFKIATREEIAAAIEERDPEVVFLHKVGPEGTKTNARCYKVIIGAADANFYYFDYHTVSNNNPNGFLESDFKKLIKK